MQKTIFIWTHITQTESGWHRPNSSASHHTIISIFITLNHNKSQCEKATVTYPKVYITPVNTAKQAVTNTDNNCPPEQ